MKNQIYRISMAGSDSKTHDLEFSVVETNDVEPYRETLEIGVFMIVGDTQLDGDLDEAELKSLIKYLENCLWYIEEFNRNSRAKEAK